MTASATSATMLHLAPGLDLPAEAVTQTFAILGKRGSGKTNTAGVMAEEMLASLRQVVIVDPLDVWWGLRSTRDGKQAGYAVTILGGDHADLPLESTVGVLVADFVVDSGASIILSLRHFSNNEQRRFVTDFCERLFHRKGPQEHRHPLHLILDEADEFAPQKILAGQERVFGAIDRIVRRGRASGLGVTLISQRAAVVNKDVLTQAEVLICHQTISPQDRKALDAWVGAHDAHNQRGAFMESLAALGLGEAWIWSPGWLNLFKRVKIDARRTFDSSATPKLGQAQVKPRELATVDLHQLELQMASTIERQKADDPKELRRKIAELEKKLAASAEPSPHQAQVQSPTRPHLTAVHPPISMPVAHTGPQQRILDSIAQWESVFIAECSDTQIAFLANYSPKSSGYEKARGQLSQLGMIRKSGGGLWSLTDAGRKQANRPADALTDEMAQTRILARLTGPQRRILEPLIKFAQSSMDNVELARAAGYSSPKSSGYEKARGRLGSLGLIEYNGRGFFRAKDVLFPEGKK